MSELLKLAVVGHTNTGKTSLMRTLLRDSDFGEVKDAAATTRHVEQAQIGDFVQLFDTPGLEDAGGILDWLESETDAKQDGIERLQQFLHSEVAKSEFAQEAKVLRQLLNSDCALYVVDAREPVLPKYKDELTVLSWCAKPIMPVFNFVANRDLNEWQTMLARRNLHVFSSFDTVAFDFDGELRLWENLAIMLPERRILDDLMHTRRQEWQGLDHAARHLIADFLLNVAAYRQTFDEKDDVAQHQQNMQTTIRQCERQFQKQLFELYRFYHQDLETQSWVLQAVNQDPFDAALWKHYGMRTSKGMATGALIGLGVDAMTLGFSLGLGTVIGSLMGGVAFNWQVLSDKMQGVKTLLVDNATLTILAARALDLLVALQSRGHAAQQNIVLHSGKTPWLPEKLPEVLLKARTQEKWSSLNGHRHATEYRAEATIKLAAQIIVN